MTYELECDCGSHQFKYDSVTGDFTCSNCLETINETDAGKHLIAYEPADSEEEA